MQRIFLNVLLVITAVVLCALPFFMLSRNAVYVYTKSHHPNSREEGFVEQLEKNGYKVYINKESANQEEVAIWFKSFNSIPKKEAKAKFTYNFIYSEDYSTFGWGELDDSFIVLTPYIEIYEYYMRSNIKSALFYLGANTKDFASVTGYKEQIEDQTKGALNLNKISSNVSVKRFDELLKWLKMSNNNQ